MNENTLSVYYYSTPIGLLAIHEHGKFIAGVSFARRKESEEAATVVETPGIRLCYQMIIEYLKGDRKDFEEIPVSLAGTAFQLKVWQALAKIPYGETRSYKDVAEAIGQPLAIRAVGAACNKNPVAVLVPCHRVVGSDGSLTGYAGGVRVKQKLLEMEKFYLA